MMGMKTWLNELVDFLDISGQHNIDHDIFGKFSLKLVKFAFTSLSGRKRGRRFLLAGKLRIALFSDDLPPPPPPHPPYFRQTGSIQLWNHCQENKGPHCNGHLANPNFAIQVLPLEIDKNVKRNAQ